MSQNLSILFVFSSILLLYFATSPVLSQLLAGNDGDESNLALPIDQQMAEKIRGIIKHFKQDDPRGIPPEIGDVVKDPMPIPNLEQSFSGTKMKFEDLNMYGLSTFRLDYARALISDMKIAVGLSIEQLQILGKYQMSSWFTRSKGNCNITVIQVAVEAAVDFFVDPEGILQVENIAVDVKFNDIKMNFENLGFLASVFQGMINSVGSFLFDSIKPMILSEAESRVRRELNDQTRSMPQRFPNSISPVDMFIASARVYMREKELDPFFLPNYTWTKFDLDQGELIGLSSIHRTGPIAVEFEENIVKITVNVGAENLKGKYRWTLNIIRDFYSISGEMEFNLEYITAAVKVGQPANLDELVTIDELDLEIGNIAVLSDGTGTLDYAIEAFINIVPNLLRKPIIDALEDPIRNMIQDEVRKALNIEAEIEKRLPPSASITETDE
ncbi:hypothetical protein Ocin01_05122 [Orchesella cincta]|uniref:Uncharacterized protein n=1 Tax=Orchesella cincta TaxID=48709 RepID=A0A1D2N8H5_ORCCI|nr:hypothetical protein Ocin01_05122 [Orchesella cincta]